MNTISKDALTAAIEYVRRGWPVLPIKPDGKEPLTTNGFYNATTDKGQIRTWWSEYPDANVGIRMGYGACVIDVDNKHGKNGDSELAALERKLGRLPPTYTVQTASVGPTGKRGFQLYFKFPIEFEDALIKKQLSPSIDLKIKNAYVVAPPSVIEGRAYRVTDVREPADLPPTWVNECIKPEIEHEEWKRIRPEGAGSSICAEYRISIGDVLTLPSDARKTGDGYKIRHPVHGATGDGNLFVNTSLDLWCCYRHYSGGDPLTWVAVREGFIQCEDAHAGCIDKETAKRCLDVLKRDGVIAGTYDHELTKPSKIPVTVNELYDTNAVSAVITVNGRRKELSLPPIPDLMVVDGPKTIEDLLEVFHERLYIEEDYNVVGPVCAFISNFLPHEPDIIGVVSPSGSIKTEVIRSFGESQNKYCYPISSITEHTFASGLKDNIDTIPLLRGRVVTIKDLTTLLSKKEDIRSAVFADFREITDGYLHKEFGNGVKKEFHDIHSSILFASTPAIERYYSMYSNLGARMVFIRPQNDPIKARQKSRENQPRIKTIRKELHEAMLSFVDASVKRIMAEPLPNMPDEIAEEIGNYCDLLAWLRYPLHHDFKGNIDEVPDPEFPTRLMNTISKLTQVHAFLYQRGVVGDADLQFALRIVTDNIPTARAAVIKQMTGEWLSKSVLSELTHVSHWPLSYRLDELVALRVCDMKSRESVKASNPELDARSNFYRIRSEWLPTIENYKGVIRIGGRMEEVSGIKSEKEGQNEDIPITPQNSTLIISQADFEQYVINTLGGLSGADHDPYTLLNEMVTKYCDANGITTDRQTRRIFAERFAELVNGLGPATSIFLRLTGGKPLALLGL